MKKKILSILCVLVLLLGVLGLGSMVSAANDISNLKVGYAKISIDPVDAEGTYRTIDYGYVLESTASSVAALQEKLAAAGVTLENPTYTVPTLLEEIAAGNLSDSDLALVPKNTDGSYNLDEGYFSMPLAGYGSNDGRMSLGKMDDNGDGVVDEKDGNFITCIAVSDEKGKTLLFFSMDLIGASDYADYAVRDEIQAALLAANADFDVPSVNMFFSASHTHSSPDTGINNSYTLAANAAQRAYDNLLIAKTKEVAIAAMADRTEVSVSSGEIQAENMNATRHYNIAEQSTVTTTKGWLGGSNSTKNYEASWVYGDNFGGGLPTNDQFIADGKGTTESGNTITGTTKITTNYQISNVSQANETLQLVQFTPVNAADKDPIVMVNFRAHPKLNSTATTDYGNDNRRYSSGDYAVMLREKLQVQGYRASFIQGAAGNQNTWNYMDDGILTPKVSNTTPGTAMYSEIIQPRSTTDKSILSTYNDQMSFISYYSSSYKRTTNVQTGYAYGARLADYALAALKSDSGMETQDNGVIKTEKTYFTGAPQLYSEGLTAAAVNYKENGALSYLYNGKYYNLNSKYHADAVYGRRNKTANDVDAKLELNCITIGSLAFVSAPNELYDRYNYDKYQAEVKDANGNVIEASRNLWDVFNEAAHEEGYITPIVLGYTNGSEGYIPNVAAYEYNQANNDAGTVIRPSSPSNEMIIGVGAYEANTSNFASGSGEQIIGLFQKTLLGMKDEHTTCPMCGEENVQWEPWWDPSKTSFDGGHYYLADDLVQYISTPAYQRTVYSDTCIDLNGHVAGNSSNQTGRAFYVQPNVTLRMMNGTVKGRGLSSGSTGGVISVGNGGSLYMTDVIVTREVYNGQTASNGGAIYAGTNCKITLKDCSVTGGIATADGGNLYVNTGSIVTLDGVTMEGGTATGKGDNICAWNKNTTICGDSVLKGESYFDAGADVLAVTFKDNVQAFESPNGVNIKLAYNTRLKFADLADTAKISVQGYACITDTTGISLVGKQLIADQGFYLDKSFTNRGVFAGDKWMCECGGMAADKHTCEYHAYSPWTSNNSLPTVGNIYLKNDVTITAQASPNDSFKNLRIDLAGHDITHKVVANSTNTRVFTLGSGELLTLTDTVGGGTLKRDLSNLTAAQQSAVTNYGVGVCVNDGATFRMYGGAIDMRGQNAGGGAIAGITGNTVVDIYGGTIYGATATDGGGIFSKGEVNLYGGLITEGKSNRGGGVFMSTATAKLKMTGDACVTGNYKADGTTPSNINAAPTYLTISGAYTGTAGINVTNPARGTVVAISDAADITHAILSVDGNSAYGFAVSGNSVVLTSSEGATVADSKGNFYTSMEEALASYTDSSVVLTLMQDVTSDITVSMDTTVELAGHSITGAITYNNGAKLTISDSNTADYTVEDGNGYGTVPYSTNVVAAAKHLLYVDGNVASAHAYDVRLSGIALRPKAQGIYYTSSFKGDECVKSMVAEFGVSLRVNAAPDAAYIQADPNGKTHTCQLKDSWVVGENDTAYYGTLLENIMMPGNGSSVNGKNAQIPVYGMPYIKLSDGTYLFGSDYSCSLKDLVELVDSKTLYKVQKEALVDMYSRYGSVMSAWNIPQIKGAYQEANPYAGLTASFVGDSITYGAKLASTENRYWQNLAASLDLAEAAGFGVSGSCYSTYNDRGTDYQPLVNRYQNVAGNDLIFIFMGTNDFSHETPLGTTADTTDISLCGAMNIVLNGLKAAHPDSKIVLLTPIQRYDMTTNDIGLTLLDYVNTIKAVGEYHNIPVLDLYTPSLTQLPVEYMDATDKVHPVAEGHVILADMIKTLLEENKDLILK